MKKLLIALIFLFHNYSYAGLPDIGDSLSLLSGEVEDFQSSDYKIINGDLYFFIATGDGMTNGFNYYKCINISTLKRTKITRSKYGIQLSVFSDFYTSGSTYVSSISRKNCEVNKKYYEGMLFKSENADLILKLKSILDSVPKVVPPTVKNPAKPAKIVKIQTLAELREKALDDSSIIMMVITPSLIRKNGQISGVRVYPRNKLNRPLFRALDLRNGDIITKVNDIAVDSSDKAMEALGQITNSSSLSISILRGGNKQILTPSF